MIRNPRVRRTSRRMQALIYGPVMVALEYFPEDARLVFGSLTDRERNIIDRWIELHKEGSALEATREKMTKSELKLLDSAERKYHRLLDRKGHSLDSDYWEPI